MKTFSNIIGFIGAFIVFSPVYIIYGVVFIFTLGNRNIASNIIETLFDLLNK